MKKLSFLIAAALSTTMFIGCGNPSTTINVHNDDTPKDYSKMTHAELRQEKIGYVDAKALKNTGKIYMHGDYLYINEQNRGIHIINNSNPADPKNEKFLTVAGNVDIAIKDNILYADNCMDLIAMDMTSGKTHRVEDVFKTFEVSNGNTITRFTQSTSNNAMGIKYAAVSSTKPSSGGAAPNQGPGTGGSMARFTIIDNYLYVLDGDNMKIFDITVPFQPKKINEVAIGFEVETIFPYGDKLFIGGTQGMYVYDNSDPTNPQKLSQFEHAVACDPVVVEDDIAYITLRSESPCNNNDINELLVVDVSNVTSPRPIAQYDMRNPHGLAVVGNTMYLCDGKMGLRVYDVTNKNEIVGNLLWKNKDVHAYDVIPRSDMPVLMVVGKDGLYQYDCEDPTNLKEISKIEVEREATS